MISRRLFLGGLVTSTATAPLLETFIHDLNLELDRALELQEGDVLVVHLDDLEMSEEQLAHATDLLERKVWPNILILPKGVELEVLRRADRHFAAAELFRSV